MFRTAQVFKALSGWFYRLGDSPATGPFPTRQQAHKAWSAASSKLLAGGQ